MTVASDLSRLLDAQLPISHVFYKLKAPDKARLLASLAAKAAEVTGMSADEMATALRSRESLGSTGIGRGIAVPHARIEKLASLTCFFARLDRAIDFEAVDGAPVDLVFLLFSPAQESNAHLATLAAVTRKLRDPAIAASVRAAASAQNLRDALTRT